MRYFITLSYDGTAYHGWQIQPNAPSVEETIEKALSTVLRRDVDIVGAGRTDAGVSASMMVAHFDFDAAGDCNEWCSQLRYRLNRMLPADIAVHKVEPVGDDMHARFSAKSRTYRYFIHLHKNPFLNHYSWRVPYTGLDFDRMNEAAMVIMEYRDFTSFSKTNTDTKTNECTITGAEWRPVQGTLPDNSAGQWVFEITANRFLRNMVRAIVGTLLDVGRGRLTVDDVRRIIEKKDRCSAGESVPGNALFLVNIEY